MWYRRINDVCWFEYHCLESENSSDAKLWRHTHQKVKVLDIVEKGLSGTKDERLKNGTPAVYRVKFPDGFEYDVFEDELLENKKQFVRR